MGGDGIRPVGHRPGAVAPGGEDDRKLRSLGRFDVVAVIAHHEGGAGRAAGGLEGGEQVARVWLAEGEGVAAADGGEVGAEPQGVEQVARRGLGLVGADGEGETRVGEAGKRGGHTGEGFGVDGGVGGVVGEEGLEGGFVEGVVARGEGLFDQGAGAVADPGDDFAAGEGGKAQGFGHAVCGGVQVGRGVDEGSVEVEEDGGHRGLASGGGGVVGRRAGDVKPSELRRKRERGVAPFRGPLAPRQASSGSK
ncbi:MAG: hypothetical protein RML45_08625 [Acetobacteraceae bacterium]|nr:hypothetical protein [Acetobacteraceae bacterium]